ncbi:MAG: xanthine dehydrogenase accessory protein XdhC [Pseudomonadota bacterium]
MAETGNPTDFLAQHAQVICAQLSRVRGSSPREEGAQMLIARTALWGSVGGGQLEHMVIDRARAMMAARETQARMDVPLGPEIDQCCGGRVTVELYAPTPGQRTALIAEAVADIAARPHVYVFGAGHVGRALCNLLQFMPVKTVLVDARAHELAQCNAAVARDHTVLPESVIRNAPAGSAALILTHAHAQDFLIASEALAAGYFAYVGMIGSRTKRAKFLSWCRAADPAVDSAALICPMAPTASTDKRPEVIASFIVAEVMARLTAEPAIKDVSNLAQARAG